MLIMNKCLHVDIRRTDGQTDKVITIGLPHLWWRGPYKCLHYRDLCQMLASQQCWPIKDVVAIELVRQNFVQSGMMHHSVRLNVWRVSKVFKKSHGHSWRVWLAKQETLTPPGHLVTPLVCRGPWMSTVVLYCWCHSDSASVLLYFTLPLELHLYKVRQQGELNSEPSHYESYVLQVMLHTVCFSTNINFIFTSKSC